MIVPPDTRSAPPSQPTHRRWCILAVLGLAQLMVVLDATIVNVALPEAASALGFATEQRQWVVTSYALAFGSLLLLGGRLSDRWGQRPALLVGLGGFAATSTLGGAAGSFEVLVAARAGQGLFAALLAPAALSLLNVTFTDPVERSRAFGVFGAVSGAGAAVGLLLGGALTQFLDWSWCLYVNDLFALAAAGGALWWIPRHTPPPRRTPLDLPGSVTVVVGLLALVYGLSQAESRGWGSLTTIGLLVLGAAALGTFVLVEQRVEHPLLPLRILADRSRAGSLISLALSSCGIFAVFLFLTFFFQENLALSPLVTGTAFIPVVLAITVAAAGLAPRMLARHGPRRPVVAGALLGAAGLALFSRLDVASDFLVGVLPGSVLVGLGLGLIFGAATAAATADVPHDDSGVASALVNAVQQVGGALGTAFLTTLAAQTTQRALSEDTLPASAAVSGYGTAFAAAAALFVIMAAVCAAVMPTGAMTTTGPEEPRR